MNVNFWSTLGKYFWLHISNKLLFKPMYSHWIFVIILVFNSLKLFSSCPHYRQPNTGFLKVRVIFGYPPWKGLTSNCSLCLHGNRIIIKYFDHIYETIQISFSTSSIRLMRLLDWFQYHINHIHETMKKPLCPLRPVYKKTEVLGLFSWYLSGQASKTSLVG